MPYVIRGNCVYKKSGKKVGCSKDVKKYMRALYAAENRSSKSTKKK
jgi:hypothetical protein